jgi:hypothetical protein
MVLFDRIFGGLFSPIQLTNVDSKDQHHYDVHMNVSFDQRQQHDTRFNIHSNYTRMQSISGSNNQGIQIGTAIFNVTNIIEQPSSSMFTSSTNSVQLQFVSCFVVVAIGITLLVVVVVGSFVYRDRQRHHRSSLPLPLSTLPLTMTRRQLDYRRTHSQLKSMFDHRRHR